MTIYTCSNDGNNNNYNNNDNNDTDNSNGDDNVDSNVSRKIKIEEDLCVGLSSSRLANNENDND